MNHLPKLLLIALLLLPARMYANNVNGGELYFEQVSDSTYRFILKLYWNCEIGIPEPASMPLCFYDGCTATYSSTTMVKDINRPEVPAPCPSFPTVCSSTTSSISGTRLLTYSVPVTLPARCANWRFFSYYNHRNVVMNLAGNTIFYAEATINNTVYNNNSAAVSSIPDVINIRQNVNFTYDLNITDANGDSTTIENTAPLHVGSTVCTTSTSAVPYISKTPSINIPNNPFQTNNTYTLNPLAKTISFTPVEAGDQTMELRIREYRTGSQIASYLKEIRYHVIPASAFNYTISSTLQNPINCTTSGNSIYACIGQNISFSVDIKSTDPQSYLSITDNHVYSAPGSAVTYSGQNKDSIRATFQWNPMPTSANSHHLIYSIKDSSCKTGLVYYSSFAVRIYPVSKTEALKDTSICAGSSYTLSAIKGGAYTWSILPGGSGSSLSCTTCTNPVATPAVTTSYVVTSAQSAYCGNNKDTVTITVLPVNVPTVTLPPTYLYYSSSNPVTITATVTNCTSPTYTWKRNGVVIAGANSNIYVLSPASNSNIDCQVSCADACSMPKTVTASTTVRSAQSVAKTTTALQVYITPNPNNGSFELAGLATKAGMVQYTITNLAGQTMLNGQYAVAAGSYKQTLKTNLPAGLYILKLEDDDNSSAIQKLIIQ